MTRDFRPRLNRESNDLINGGNRILIIADIHEPFTLKGYFEFCVYIYKKYNCNQVVFTGDIIDNHYSSFHDTDPDGHGGATELKLAKRGIKKWYKQFPKAKVCLGNHDLIPNRKAFNAGVSDSWIMKIGDVLNTPNWEYSEEFIIDGIKYCHGTGRKAKQRAKDDLISIVQGHYHGEGYISNYVGENYKIFAMQLGCGIDRKAYSMAYGKHFKKMHINCGVMLNKMPILEYMDL